MAQLIKLQDYISRYEFDLYRYPTQFVRFKKQQWEKTQQKWEVEKQNEGDQPIEEEVFELEKAGFFQRVKGLFKKNVNTELEDDDLEKWGEMKETEVFPFHFNLSHPPKNKHELKKLFLEQLFQFQLKWASSTLTEKSYIDQKYIQDERLQFFLQRFPDTFLLMYEPILRMKNAPVELDHLLITPTEVWCISFLEDGHEATFVGSNDRFWTKKIGEQEEKVLSPAISLNRMGIIISQLFKLYEVEFPVKKLVLSRNGYIDFPTAPFDLEIVDCRNFNQWFESMRKLHSPLKRMQMKATKSLLDYAQTTSIRRPEWDMGIEDPFVVDE
ncbi:hypothetical protein J2S13_002164 [Oikeobacillus pervagus]|uniref:NERD domain-containing protein n=1 Tax=Oikeobacillus pervagus TaxID=1325931 RepID=A0AAJ1SZX3_9BACI|nr:NERD domain-containing protein [Oikeobacillus pervagus]MDQ0215744.1 hypothetical protein [Oikeobacillus pervagus]